MRNSYEFVKSIRVFILICGFLAIVISSLDLIVQDRIEEDLSQITQGDEDNPTKNTQKIIYLPDYLATITTFQVDAHPFLQVLFQYPVLTVDINFYEHALEFGIADIFEVLFQNIIAPNAP